MALNSFREFNQLVDKIAHSNTVGLQKEFSVDMLTSFARPTPVDTGRATANWKAAVNKDPQPNENQFDRTPSASPTTRRAREDLKSLGKNDKVVIKNAVSSGIEGGYIIKLEMGHSQQAPTGMFRKNVVKAKQVMKKSKKRIGL